MGSVVPSPIDSSTNYLLAAAGLTTKVETQSSLGWKVQLSIPLPSAIYAQCMVLMNSTAAILIGGYQPSNPSNNTYIITNSTRKWSPGPPLNDARVFHTCGRILTNKTTKTYGILVVTGIDGTHGIPSVELLDQGASSFVRGKPFFTGLYYNSLVEDPAGGIIVIGGMSDTSTCKKKFDF